MRPRLAIDPPRQRPSIEEMEVLLGDVGDAVRASVLPTESLLRWLSEAEIPTVGEVSQRWLARVAALRDAVEREEVSASITMRDAVDSARVGLSLLLELRGLDMAADTALAAAIDSLPEIDQRLGQFVSFHDVLEAIDELPDDVPELSWWYSLPDAAAIVSAPRPATDDTDAPGLSVRRQAPTGPVWAIGSWAAPLFADPRPELMVTLERTSRDPTAAARSRERSSGALVGSSTPTGPRQEAPESVEAVVGEWLTVEVFNPDGEDRWGLLCMEEGPPGAAVLRVLLLKDSPFVVKARPQELGSFPIELNEVEEVALVLLLVRRDPATVLKGKPAEWPPLSPDDLERLEVSGWRRVCLVVRAPG
jgi:hypothetical protein